MNVEELEQLVTKAKLGDISAEEKIFYSFIPYINLLISKFNINGYDRDDLVQECYLVLNKAIRKYKGNRTFAIYVTKALKNNMLYLLRKSTKLQYSIIDNLLEAPNNIEIDVLSHLELEHLSESLKNLSEKELKIIKDYYFNDITLLSISKALDEKYITTAKAKERAITKLKKCYEKEWSLSLFFLFKIINL